MVKKSDSFAGRLTDNELANSILESANQIWLAGLGAFATAQEEGSKAFDTFVKTRNMGSFSTASRCRFTGCAAIRIGKEPAGR